MQGSGRRSEETAQPTCRKGKNPLQLTALLERVCWRRRRDGRQKIVRKKLEGNSLFSFSNPCESHLEVCVLRTIEDTDTDIYLPFVSSYTLNAFIPCFLALSEFSLCDL